MKAAGAVVFVTEIDPICALQALTSPVYKHKSSARTTLRHMTASRSNTGICREKKGVYNTVQEIK